MRETPHSSGKNRGKSEAPDAIEVESPLARRQRGATAAGLVGAVRAVRRWRRAERSQQAAVEAIIQRDAEALPEFVGSVAAGQRTEARVDLQEHLVRELLPHAEPARCEHTGDGATIVAAA